MKSPATSFILPRAVCTTIVLAVALAVATPCRAQSSSSFGAAIEDYFINWFPRVTQIQSEQPHWVTPLVTVTPRLEEEVRYDQFFQSSRNGLATDNFGAGKGLELIPFQNTEVIVGMPPLLKRNMPRNTDGFGDWPFLLKLRLLSSNEEHDNYIVTAFMGFSVPTGSKVNGNGHGIFTPTIAAGKASATSMSNRRLASRFPAAVWTDWGCRWRGIPLSSIASSNVSGRSLKPTTTGNRTAPTRDTACSISRRGS